VTRGDLSPAELGAGDDAAAPAAAHAELAARIARALADCVSEVRVSRRLVDSPACLVAGADGLNRNLERILHAAGRNIAAARPVLEVNPDHPLLVRLAGEGDEGRFADWARLLFDQAVLVDGGQIDEPAGFVARLNRLLLGGGD
jgi:molecular chaperone HtpG